MPWGTEIPYQGRHMVEGRKFSQLFFRINVIDLWKILEIRQISCPTKILLHIIYILVYLRKKENK